MPARIINVALVGNPNAGKTTLFNALSGLRHRVGNYPGVTVEMKKGRARLGDTDFELIDLPGTYSLAARSPDEMVAVDLLLGHCPGEPPPDVVLAIVDASNLERHLYLTTQLLDLKRPVVVALNMMDVAAGQGLQIDVERLGGRLGVPVVPIQANKGVGLDRLKQALIDAVGQTPPAAPAFPDAVEAEVRAFSDNGTPPFLARRILLDIDGHAQRRYLAQHPDEGRARLDAARARLAAAGAAPPMVEARTRYQWIRERLAGCIVRPALRPLTWTDRIDRVLTHRVWGTLVFLVIMFLVFQAIFTAAKPLMDLLDAGKDLAASWVGGALPAGPLRSLLVDGVLNGVGGIIIFIPQILILFGFIAVLEDCGYMARAAFLMDRLMSRAGLSGKSFIPMLSSLACAVPGIMAARVIENRRDRLATILVAPLMSCSARLPLYLLLIGAFVKPGRPWWVPGLTMFAMYLIGFIAAPLVALILKRTLLRGETPVFVMEMPLYQWPSPRTVVRRMLDAAGAFVRRAGTIILATMVLVWALMYFPRGDASGQRYDLRTHALSEEIDALETQRDAADAADRGPLESRRAELSAEHHRLFGEWKRGSYLGRAGRAVEPVVRPLGWDWRIGTAAIASFPAREVVVGTLGVIFNQGEVDAGEIAEADDPGATALGAALREATWDDQPGRPLFTLATALSLMVFFALCCQCASTLAVIRRETRSWAWPAFTFVYMTGLAYVAALAVYQIASRV